MGLFDRVFRGSDEMYFKAESELNQVIAELGEDAAMTMPDTAYFLACIYAYLGKKVTTLKELKAALASPPPAARKGAKPASMPAIPSPMRAPSTTATSPTPRCASWAFRWLPATSPASWS